MLKGAFDCKRKLDLNFFQGYIATIIIKKLRVYASMLPLYLDFLIRIVCNFMKFISITTFALKILN